MGEIRGKSTFLALKQIVWQKKVSKLLLLFALPNDRRCQLFLSLSIEKKTDAAVLKLPLYQSWPSRQFDLSSKHFSFFFLFQAAAPFFTHSLIMIFTYYYCHCYYHYRNTFQDDCCVDWTWSLDVCCSSASFFLLFSTSYFCIFAYTLTVCVCVGCKLNLLWFAADADDAVDRVILGWHRQLSFDGSSILIFSFSYPDLPSFLASSVVFIYFITAVRGMCTRWSHSGSSFDCFSVLFSLSSATAGSSLSRRRRQQQQQQNCWQNVFCPFGDPPLSLFSFSSSFLEFTVTEHIYCPFSSIVQFDSDRWLLERRQERECTAGKLSLFLCQSFTRPVTRIFATEIECATTVRAECLLPFHQLTNSSLASFTNLIRINLLAPGLVWYYYFTNLLFI